MDFVIKEYVFQIYLSMTFGVVVMAFCAKFVRNIFVVFHILDTKFTRINWYSCNSERMECHEKKGYLNSDSLYEFWY